MKKETIIRQNRCDQEMNFLLFGCFFLYMAMQLFIRETSQLALVNGINMALYLVFVPGFLFRLGYCFNRTARLKSEERGKERVLLDALRFYVYFFALALGQEVIQHGATLRSSFTNILTLVTIPSIPAVFFTMALTLALVWVFYEKLCHLAAYGRRLVVLTVIFLLCAFLRTGADSYPIVASLTGSALQPAVPGLPYFAFFLLGMWFEEKKPGFQWRLLGAAAVVTAVSAVLVRTPLHDLGVVAVSALPVYLVYFVAEWLSDVTLRFRTAAFVCETIEQVFWAYSILLFAVYRYVGSPSTKAGWVLLLGAAAWLLIYGAILGIAVVSSLYARAAKAFEEKVRHKTAVYFMVFTAVFAFMLVLAFIDFIRFDRTLLWKNDTISQYYPKAVYFANYIRDLVAGLARGNFTLPMYDFSLGLGREVTYSLEPLYFLYALFGADKVELASTVITLLRFYLAGISISVFCFYFKKDYFSTFLASAVYVFCGFSLYGGARHTFFMIPMIMLPLLILAIEEILRGKRWYLCTIFVAVSLFSNYYYLYMNTIAMGIYFLVRFFCQKDRSKKTFGGFMIKGLTISGSYLLGVGMSCIVLVTTFGLYVGSGRSGEVLIKTPSLFYYSVDWLVRCFMSFPTTVNSPGDWLKLGFLPVSFFAIVFMFTRKGRKELKVLSVIAVILMAFPLSGFVFSGFSSVVNRWCYMLSLLVAYIVADCLPDMKQMKKKDIIACLAAVAVYAYLAYWGNYLHTKYTRLAAMCLVLTFVLILLSQDTVKKLSKYTKQVLMVLLTFAMILINGHTLYSVNGTVKEYAFPGETQEEAEDTPMIAVEELGDDSFYRVATSKLDYHTVSSSMIFGYNSIYLFSSTQNSSIMEYMEKMGCTSYSVTQFLGLNNRTFMSALASIKYYAYYAATDRPLPCGYEEIKRTETNGKETIICENQYALPLGYTYEAAISEEELEQYDVLERQEVMMQKAVLSEEAASELKNGGAAAVTAELLELQSVEENGLCLTDRGLSSLAEDQAAEEADEEEALAEDEILEEAETPQGYSMTLHFAERPKTEIYLVFKNAVLEGDMSETPINFTFEAGGGKRTYKFRSDDDRYGTGQQDYVFNLGYFEEGVSSCKISVDREGEILFDALEIYSQPMDNLEQYTAALTEDVLEHVELGTNRVSGTISLDEDKILVLSIPYQKGWTAYVDGEETDLERANYMYMALPLSAGEHSIELEFAIPGVKYALVIMPASVVLFIVLCIVTHIRRKKTIRKQ